MVGSEKHVSAFCYTHQIHDIGHGEMAEDRHASDKLDHGFVEGGS